MDGATVYSDTTEGINCACQEALIVFFSVSLVMITSMYSANVKLCHILAGRIVINIYAVKYPEFRRGFVIFVLNTGALALYEQYCCSVEVHSVYTEYHDIYPSINLQHLES